MMRESFPMNRPEELERFFNSFSYSEICHELAADGTSCVSNEKPLAVYHNNQVQNNSLKQVSIQAERKKDIQTTTSDKRKRTLFTPFQLARMEDEFRQNMYVVGLKRWRLATELGLTEKQVKIWFQNRRMKLKREQVKSRCINDGFPWY